MSRIWDADDDYDDANRQKRVFQLIIRVIHIHHYQVCGRNDDKIAWKIRQDN